MLDYCRASMGFEAREQFRSPSNRHVAALDYRNKPGVIVS
jgi:hypothetical protein